MRFPTSTTWKWPIRQNWTLQLTPPFSHVRSPVLHWFLVYLLISGCHGGREVYTCLLCMCSCFSEDSVSAWLARRWASTFSCLSAFLSAEPCLDLGTLGWDCTSQTSLGTRRRSPGSPLRSSGQGWLLGCWVCAVILCGDLLTPLVGLRFLHFNHTCWLSPAPASFCFPSLALAWWSLFQRWGGGVGACHWCHWFVKVVGTSRWIIWY